MKRVFLFCCCCLLAFFAVSAFALAPANLWFPGPEGTTWKYKMAGNIDIVKKGAIEGDYWTITETDDSFLRAIIGVSAPGMDPLSKFKINNDSVLGYGRDGNDAMSGVYKKALFNAGVQKIISSQDDGDWVIIPDVSNLLCGQDMEYDAYKGDGR